MSIGKLAGQTAVYGISSIVARLLNYLLTPYLTRIMSPAEYGVITDMYALIPFALVLLTMGLESGYFRFAGKAGSPQEKQRAFSTVWGAVAVVSLLFMALVLLFRGEIAAATGYGSQPSFVWIVGAIIALDSIAAIPLARLREQGRAKLFVAVRLFSVIVNVVLCLFFYSVLPSLTSWASFYDPGFGAGYYLVSNLIASALTLLILIYMARGGGLRIDRRLLGQIMIYSLPLLVGGIAGTANEYIDRQMIKFLMPQDAAMDALGIYGAVVKIGVVLLLFTQMYRLGAEPYFLAGFKKEEFLRTNAEAMKFFVAVLIAIFLGITLFTDLFELIIGPKFRSGIYILPIVLVSNMLSGVVLNLSFWYKQMSRTVFALVITGTGLLFTVVFNVLLVPQFGILGAALARLVCEAVMVVLSYALSRKYCPVPYDLKRIGGYILLGTAIYALSFLSGMLPVVWKYLCNLVLLVLFGLYVAKREGITPWVLLKRK